MKKNVFFVFVFFAIILSCNKDKIVIKVNSFNEGYFIDYFKNKEITSRELYSRDSLLIAKMIYNNNKIMKSEVFFNKRVVAEYKKDKNDFYKSIIYYDNAKIYGHGKIDSLSREIGWWDFYDNDGNLIQKQQYLIIRNKQINNQSIIYKNKVIDTIHSDFFSLKIKNKIDKNRYNLNFFYNRKLDKKSFVTLLISNDLNYDFNNESSINYDTIAFGDKKEMIFPVVFKTTGKKKLKGIILEQYEIGKSDNSDSLKLIERKTYLNEEILVK